MKLHYFVFAFITAYAVTAFPTQQDAQQDDELVDFVYPRYITFPDGDGNPHLVDLEAPVEEEFRDVIARNDDINEYHLFTRVGGNLRDAPRNRDSHQLLFVNNAESVRNSNFNPQAPTVVVVHGWLSKSDTNLNPAIRNAFLNRFDYNVIILDWRRLAISGYVTAANAVPGVGRNLANFLRFLNSLGSSLRDIHIIGFSLGGHVVGSTGRELGGAVGRVTAMDPAGPLWTLSNNRLSPDSGVYVEAIHTDGGYTVGGLGIGRDVAQVDIYANGGISQPGCLTNICNHNRAWEFFAASVSYNHLIGNRCTSSTQINLNTCRGDQFPLGNGYPQKSGNGRFRVNTGRRYPFGNVDD